MTIRIVVVAITIAVDTTTIAVLLDRRATATEHETGGMGVTKTPKGTNTVVERNVETTTGRTLRSGGA
jgi:hypothetical protein